MKIKDLQYSLDIPRKNLPQIDFEQLDEILSSLTKDFEIFYGTIPCDQLKPVQDQLNLDKISSIIKDEKHLDDRRLFVSKEAYIIDGHHYWAANLKENPDRKLNVFLVKANVIDLINWFNNSDFVEHKNINESKIQSR